MKKVKPRVIQDYKKLSKELQEQVKLAYPDGFTDYLIEFSNAKGELVSALTFETEDKIYMIRMSKSYANTIVSDDDDDDELGVLKSGIKDDYEEKYGHDDYRS